MLKVTKMVIGNIKPDINLITENNPESMSSENKYNVKEINNILSKYITKLIKEDNINIVNLKLIKANLEEINLKVEGINSKRKMYKDLNTTFENEHYISGIFHFLKKKESGYIQWIFDKRTKNIIIYYTSNLLGEKGLLPAYIKGNLGLITIETYTYEGYYDKLYIIPLDLGQILGQKDYSEIFISNLKDFEKYGYKNNLNIDYKYSIKLLYLTSKYIKIVPNRNNNNYTSIVKFNKDNEIVLYNHLTTELNTVVSINLTNKQAVLWNKERSNQFIKENNQICCNFITGIKTYHKLLKYNNKLYWLKPINKKLGNLEMLMYEAYEIYDIKEDFEIRPFSIGGVEHSITLNSFLLTDKQEFKLLVPYATAYKTGFVYKTGEKLNHVIYDTKGFNSFSLWGNYKHTYYGYDKWLSNKFRNINFVFLEKPLGMLIDLDIKHIGELKIDKQEIKFENKKVPLIIFRLNPLNLFKKLEKEIELKNSIIILSEYIDINFISISNTRKEYCYMEYILKTSYDRKLIGMYFFENGDFKTEIQ